MTQAYDDDPAAGLALYHGEAPAPARAATYRCLDCGAGDDVVEVLS